MLTTKLISSLEKVFVDSAPEEFAPLQTLELLCNERASFQLYYLLSDSGSRFNLHAAVEVAGDLSDYVSVRRVENVPVLMPVPPVDNWTPDNYLRTKPGLYPDPLLPLQYGKCAVAAKGVAQALWFTLDLRRAENITPGKHPLRITLRGEDGTVAEETLTVDCIGAALPAQDIIVTQWFHCDGLAQYYRLPVWSEEHWRVVENFMKVAADNGENMILVPTFTPPLDTAVGGERLTTQLVDVKVKDGKYSFGFRKLDRFLDTARRAGFRYYEIAHLFTQWGAAHAPKVMATVDGEYKRIFGWESDAVGGEYTVFVRAFLKAFLRHMKRRGEDRLCYFHISDEPRKDHLPQYLKDRESIADILAGYPIMDALSNYDFYEQGVVDLPIPCNNHIEPFIEHKVPGLWTYYCCSQYDGVSNRFVSMPSWRNRYIGVQFYKYDIRGFLHWGYNFYNNCLSVNPVNPYLDLSGAFWVSAGDAFSVYPAMDGSAHESLRLTVFYDALQDLGAMRLCESLVGREKTLAAVERAAGETVVFGHCATDAATMQNIRHAVNELIRGAIR